MARENEKIPTSRVRRTATVATLAASEAVKQFGTRAANVTRGEEAAEEAMSRRQLETAKQIVAVLGTMKGAAMKLGQVMSFLDVGLVARGAPRGVPARAGQAARRRADGLLQADAQGDRGRPRRADSTRSSRASTRSRSRRPRSARSTARRCTTAARWRSRSSTRASRGAVRADMQNLDMIMRLLKRMTPGLDVKAITKEIRERIVEELDYELEAQNQRSLARIFAGHPFIVVPDVVSSLSRERVLVSEFVRRRRASRSSRRAPAGRARPHRRDRVPLLPRLPLPPPPVLRRPAPGQLPAARGRPRGVPGLRPVQAHGGRAGRARARRRSARSSEGDAVALHALLARVGLPARTRARRPRAPARVHRRRRSGGTRPPTKRSS